MFCRYLVLSLITAFIALAIPQATGQNLVPNYSFEAYNTCPSNFVSIRQSPGYNNFPTVQNWVSASTGSPDYLNVCNTGQVGVPLNYFGYQQPHTGNAYIGAFTHLVYNNGNSKVAEYPEAKLKQAMTAGHRYHLQFYCAAATIPNYQSSYQIMGVDKIGAVFTNTQINVATGPGLFLLFYTPSVSSTAGIAIADTSNWTRVNGEYTANGGEEWITLGRFEDGLPVTQSVIIPGSVANTSSYHFFDDVVLRDLQFPDVTAVHPITISCTSTAGIPLNGRPQADEYTWSNGSTAASINVNTPGTWWVRSWKDTTYYVDTFRITRGPSPVRLRLPDDTILCTGTSFTITPNRTFSAYSWSTGATTASITVTQSGRYVLTGTDSCGIQRDTINLLLRPQLRLRNDTSVCNSASVNVAVNIPFSSYAWSTGAVTPSVMLSQSGVYTLSVSDTCGLQSDTFRLTVRPPVPPPVLRDTSLCLGTFNPAIKVAGDSLRWYSDPATTGVFTQPIINTEVAGTQTWYLSQTKGGCESARPPLEIAIVATPSVILGPDTTVCKGQVLLLGLPYLSSKHNLRWNTGQTYCPLQVSNSGYYRLTATNSCGTASDEVFVRFVECDSNGQPLPPSAFKHDCLFMPTAFTPNNDSRNDRFKISSRCLLDAYSIRIYNRWGAIVYEGDNLQVAWDGNFGGKPVPTGTYFYIISYLVANSGNVYDAVKGDILLVR